MVDLYASIPLQRALLEALVQWHSERLIESFHNDQVEKLGTPYTSITWKISATLKWDESDFNTQIKLRRAICVLGEQLSKIAEVKVESVNLSGKTMVICLKIDAS